MSFITIIPARYGSSRFPGKPLAMIHGKPMVQHVYERCLEANAHQVVVATDDDRIAKAVAEFGGQCCLTSDQHESGTTRIAEVLNILNIEDDTVVVNVQGDEPFIPSSNIQQVARNLSQYQQAQMATLCEPIVDVAELTNPNIVKVVMNHTGLALYFSRAGIPFERDAHLQDQSSLLLKNVHRHIGIYAYTAGFIRQYIQMPISDIEQIEKLEQLRVLWHGCGIHVAQAVEPPPVGIDTPDDLANLLQKDK